MIHFRRNMGFWSATFLGIGSLIGAGIFVLSGRVVNLLGPGALLAYGAAFFTAMLHLFSYAELSATYPKEGGGYVYVKETMGDLFAFVTGWLLLTGSLISCTLIALGFAEYFLNFFPQRDVLIQYAPWVAIGTTFLLVMLNMFGTRRTELFEDGASVIKVAVLLVLIGAAAPLIETENFKNISQNLTVGSFATAITLAYVAFIGFESIAIASEEVIDPKRNVPRAMMASFFITSVVYFGLLMALVGANSSFTGKAEDGLMLANLAQRSLGGFGFPLLLFGGAIATLSALNATIFAVSRKMYALGRDHFLPEALAKLHPKFKTPHLALIIVFLFVTVLSLSRGLDVIARMTGGTYLFAICFTHMALVVSRYKHVNHHRPFKVIGGLTVPILGVILNLAIVFFFEKSMLLNGLIWTLIGLALYAALLSSRSSFFR